MADPDYLGKVYQTLTESIDGFNKTEQEFRISMQDTNYANKVYQTLSEQIDGFSKTKDEFYTASGLKKKDVSQSGSESVSEIRSTSKYNTPTVLGQKIPTVKQLVGTGGIDVNNAIKQLSDRGDYEQSNKAIAELPSKDAWALEIEAYNYMKMAAKSAQQLKLDESKKYRTLAKQDLDDAAKLYETTKTNNPRVYSERAKINLGAGNNVAAYNDAKKVSDSYKIPKGIQNMGGGDLYESISGVEDKLQAEQIKYKALENLNAPQEDIDKQFQELHQTYLAHKEIKDQIHYKEWLPHIQSPEFTTKLSSLMGFAAPSSMAATGQSIEKVRQSVVDMYKTGAFQRLASNTATNEDWGNVLKFLNGGIGTVINASMTATPDGETINSVFNIPNMLGNENALNPIMQTPSFVYGLAGGNLEEGSQLKKEAWELGDLAWMTVLFGGIHKIKMGEWRDPKQLDYAKNLIDKIKANEKLTPEEHTQFNNIIEETPNEVKQDAINALSELQTDFNTKLSEKESEKVQVYDYDNTLKNDETGELTPLGEKVASEPNKDNIRIVTGNPDVETISEKTGVPKENITVVEGSPEEKAQQKADIIEKMDSEGGVKEFVDDTELNRTKVEEKGIKATTPQDKLKSIESELDDVVGGALKNEGVSEGVSEGVKSEKQPAITPEKEGETQGEKPKELSITKTIDYTKPELLKYKPNEQLKFYQGDNYEPVRIVGNSDLIELITYGSRREKQIKTGEKQNINKVRVSELENKFGITSTDAYENAKRLAKESRDKNTEKIIILDKSIPEKTSLSEIKSGKEIEPHPEVKTDVETVAKELQYSDKDVELYNELKDTSIEEREDKLNDFIGKKQDEFYDKIDGKSGLEYQIGDLEYDIEKANSKLKETTNQKQISEIKKEQKEDAKKLKELKLELEKAKKDEKYWNDGVGVEHLNTVIKDIDNRLQTRRNVASGSDLFPETANIPELQAVKKELNTHIENGTITKETVGKFEQRTADEVTKSEPTVKIIESKARDAENLSKKELEQQIKAVDDIVASATKTYSDAVSEFNAAKKKHKNYFDKNGNIKDGTPKEIVKELKDLYDVVNRIRTIEREKIVKADNRDTGLVDGINSIRDNENAFRLVGTAMNRGLIGERLYNEFGKNLLHTLDKKGADQAAEVAEIVSDFLGRENVKSKDTKRIEQQKIDNEAFELATKYDEEPIKNTEPTKELTPKELAKQKIQQSASDIVDNFMDKIGGRKSLLPEDRTKLVDNLKKFVEGVTELTVEEIRDLIKKVVSKYKDSHNISDKEIESIVDEVAPKETPEEIQSKIHIVAANALSDAIAEGKFGAEAVKKMIESLPKGDKGNEMIEQMLKSVDTKDLEKNRKNILSGNYLINQEVQAKASLDLALLQAKSIELRIKKNKLLESGASEKDLKEVSDEILQNENDYKDSFLANRAIGSEWGRFGQFRGALYKISDKYNLVDMEAEFRESDNITGELTKEQQDYIKKHYDEIKDIEAKIKEREQLEYEKQKLEAENERKQKQIDELNSIVDKYKSSAEKSKEKSAERIKKSDEKVKSGINKLMSLTYGRASVMGFLNPEIYTAIRDVISGKIEKFYEQHKAKIELNTLMKEAYEEVKKVMPEITEVDIEDAFTGNYKRPKQEKSELTKIKNELKKDVNIRRNNKHIDFGDDMTIPEMEELVKKTKEDTKSGKRTLTQPEIVKKNEDAIKLRNRQLKQIDEDIANKRYRLEEVKPFERSKELKELDRQLENKKKIWKSDRHKARMKGRPILEKIADVVNEVIRSNNLSFIGTYKKLLGVVAQNLLTKVPRMLIQKGVNKLMPKEISQYGGYWGDFELKQIGKFYADVLRTFSLKKLQETFDLEGDTEFTSDTTVKWLAYPGKTHQAIKEFIKSPEAKQSADMQLYQALKGLQEAQEKLNDKSLSEAERKKWQDQYDYFDVSDPVVMQRISDQAIADGAYSILLNNSKLGRKVKNAFGGSSKKASVRIAQKLLWKSQNTIVTVPINYFSRYLYTKYGAFVQMFTGGRYFNSTKEHVPGVPELLFKRMLDENAWDNSKLPPEVKQQIMKNVVNGSYTAMIIGIAALTYKNIDYNKDKKEFTLYGVTISEKWLHLPLMDAMLSYAMTFKDYSKFKGDEDVWRYVYTLTDNDYRQFKNMPFYNQLTYGYIGDLETVGKNLAMQKSEGVKKEALDAFSKLVGSFTAPPGFVREYAKSIDARIEDGEHLDPQPFPKMDYIFKDYPYVSQTVKTKEEKERTKGYNSETETDEHRAIRNRNEKIKNIGTESFGVNLNNMTSSSERFDQALDDVIKLKKLTKDLNQDDTRIKRGEIPLPKDIRRDKETEKKQLENDIKQFIKYQNNQKQVDVPKTENKDTSMIKSDFDETKLYA